MLDSRCEGACRVCGQVYVHKDPDLGWQAELRGAGHKDKRNKPGGRLATKAENAAMRENTAAIQSALMAVGPRRRYGMG